MGAGRKQLTQLAQNREAGPGKSSIQPKGRTAFSGRVVEVRGWRQVPVARVRRGACAWVGRGRDGR